MTHGDDDDGNDAADDGVCVYRHNSYSLIPSHRLISFHYDMIQPPLLLLLLLMMMMMMMMMLVINDVTDTHATHIHYCTVFSLQK